MKILILRFSSIGDIVLTTPVIRCLKEQIPNVEIHFGIKRQYVGVLEANPYIDRIVPLGSLYEFIKILRFERYDFIIDLHNNLRTRIIKAALGVPSFTFDKLNLEKYWLVRTKDVSIMPKVHIVDRYMDTVKALGVVNDGKGLDYFIPKGKGYEIGLLPETHKDGYMALVIGGTHATKRMPNEKLIEVIERINGSVVLLGGKEDLENAERIMVGVSSTKVLNLVGKISLNESASIVEHSSFVVTHDTGLMHIAAAFKKTVYTFWGNTVPELGMYAYNTAHIDFEVPGLPCRPCSKIGFDKCPQGHFDCMKKQDISKIPSWE